MAKTAMFAAHQIFMPAPEPRNMCRYSQRKENLAQKRHVQKSNGSTNSAVKMLATNAEYCASDGFGSVPASMADSL